MKKGSIIEKVKVEKLIFGGKGLAKTEEGKTIIIVGGPVPGATYNLKVLRNKPGYVEAQIVDVVENAGYELPQRCIMDGVSGGARWQNIPYEKQLEIKHEQIVESLHNIRKTQPDFEMLPINPSPTVWGYRNKMEYSFGNYISFKEGIEKRNLLGFHKQGEFSKVVDVTYSCLGDDEFNEIYGELKALLLGYGHDVYDQKTHKGLFRHLTIRKSHFMNEVMVIVSYNPSYEGEFNLEQIKKDLIAYFDKKDVVKSMYLSSNGGKADIAIGDLELIAGEEIIREKLHDLVFNISPRSFFQTNSTGAEELYGMVLDFAYKDDLKDKTVLDLYAGTGTIGMIFSKNAEKVVSVELVESASKDGAKNAALNGITNMEFVNAKVEDYLTEYKKAGKNADLVIIDPPRAGMHKNALPNIISFDAKQMIYVSCNPSTLARDLEYIIENSEYKIEKVRAMDMFPHTHHIETVVSLIKNKKRTFTVK